MLSVEWVTGAQLDVSAEDEDTDNGAAGEDKEELVPSLLVKDVRERWDLVEHLVYGLDGLVPCSKFLLHLEALSHLKRRLLWLNMPENDHIRKNIFNLSFLPLTH